ncbi:MAG: phenylalanine--tRNA ligase subunit alpha [bacterium]
MSLVEQLQQLRSDALAELESARDAAQLEAWRIKFLSRQGLLPQSLAGMKSVPAAERPAAGQTANEVKQTLQQTFDERKAGFETAAQEDVQDPTMPGRLFPLGATHPITQTLNRIIAIFQRMGFSLEEGPDIETEYHNFDALNTPPEHPARNEQDTFYIDLPSHPQHGRYLLRTQTSPVQIRVMERQKPPVQIIAPGRCYRRDEIDATHGVFFHQIEGLMVAEGVVLADLVGSLEFFFKELLGSEIKIRFRPHFFPFTEPSFEVDFSRPGKSVRGKEWLEICGCGMVDPAVLTNAGIDAEKYTGFAFGFGVERIAMMLHEIPDLRLFSENDIRFLRQFA